MRPRSTGAVEELAWSLDGNQLLTSATSGDGQVGTFMLWDAASLTMLKERSIAGAAPPAFGAGRKAHGELTPDGRVAALAVPPNRDPWLWRLEEHRIVRLESDDAVPEISVSPDARHALVLSPYGTQTLVDARTGKRIAAVDAITGSSTAGPVELWIPRHALLVTTDGRGRVHLWDLSEGKVAPLRDAPPNDIGTPNVAVTPDGRTLAIVLPTGTVELWSLPKRKRLRTLHTGTWAAQGDSGSPHAVTFDRDGRWLVVQLASGETRMWGMPDGERAFIVHPPVLDGGEQLEPLFGTTAFSGDGRYFVTHRFADAGSLQDTVSIVYALAEPPHEVLRVAGRRERFGGWLATGHHFWKQADGGVHEWDPVTNRSLAVRPAARFDPTDRFHARADGDLHVTRAKDDRHLTARRYRGGVIIIDEGGCISGDVAGAEAELIDADGGSPSPEVVRRSYRDDLTK